MTLTMIYMGSRDADFIESWQLAYRLSYGDFEEDYLGGTEWTLFFVATLSLSLVMLNLIIAIMGDSYDRIMEGLVIEDEKERLRLILECGKYHRCKQQWSGYLQLCKPDHISFDEAAESSWEGKVTAIKKAITAEL